MLCASVGMSLAYRVARISIEAGLWVHHRCATVLISLVALPCLTNVDIPSLHRLTSSLTTRSVAVSFYPPLWNKERDGWRTLSRKDNDHILTTSHSATPSITTSSSSLYIGSSSCPRSLFRYRISNPRTSEPWIIRARIFPI